jgi:hypothetical protein
MRSVMPKAGSTATTEVVRAFGFIVRRRRSVEGVGLVIDIAREVMVALDVMRTQAISNVQCA